MLLKGLLQQLHHGVTKEPFPGQNDLEMGACCTMNVAVQIHSSPP